MVVGVPLDDDTGFNSGSAYIYALPEPGSAAGLAAGVATLLGLVWLRRRTRSGSASTCS